MFESLKSVARPLCASVALGMIAPALAPVCPASAATRGFFAANRFASAATTTKVNYTFTEQNDSKDLTFNQLLGINNAGKIVGYFGSGASPTHPNQGYRVLPPYLQSQYTNEDFPGSVQTQVVAVNNVGQSAGFYVDAHGDNFGFTHRQNGAASIFKSFKDPNTGNGTVNQILGLNDWGIAVGFYSDVNGVDHGFELSEGTGAFLNVVPPKSTNVMATGLNNSGDITGSFVNTSGVTVGFLYKNGKYYTIVVPGSTSTSPLGINNHDEIVGSYVDTKKLTHGFTLTNPLTSPAFATIDDPHGVGSTVVNGLNDNAELVGFYCDSAGNTDGFIATP